MRISGVSYALCSAVLFGASTPAAKWILGSGVDPWLLAGMLYIGSGIGLFLVRTWQRMGASTAAETPLRRSDIPYLAAVIALGGGLAPVLLMLGLRMTSASSASLLLNLEGIATLVIAWVGFREHVDRRLLLGVVAIVAGALVLSWSGAGGVGWGGLLIAGACLAWGLDNNLTRKLSSSDPVEIAMRKGAAAGVVNLALALGSGAAVPGVNTIGAAAVVGFFGYGVSLVLFVLALRHLGTARTGAYFSTAPFIGTALSLLIFSEAVTVQIVAAAALMGIGVYIHLTEGHEHEHLHQPIEHEHRHRHDAHHQHRHGSADPPGEPHSHLHRHDVLRHKHPHYPDLHHRQHAH